MKRLLTVVVVAVALSSSSCAKWFAHPLPPEAKTHRAKTPDGWELGLVQYLPNGTPKGRPVLLCHGISANSRHMDLDEAHSLARFFASQGREAWTMSIRGTGDSDRADIAKGRKPNFTFDDVWNNDTRSAIRFVREHASTPALVLERQKDGAELSKEQLAILAESTPEIDYVGHSMGGMLVYAYLSQGGDGLHSVVILGSPTRLDWGGRVDPVVVNGSRSLISGDGAIPMENAALWSAPWQGYVQGDPMELLLYNPENTTPDSWRRLLAIGTGDISPGLWLQLASMTETGRFASADGTLDFRRDMAKVKVPALVVAGKVDRIANPAAVKDGYRALGGPKEWILAGEENGYQADYGHMDFLIGERASTELWPKLIDFLDRQQAK